MSIERVVKSTGVRPDLQMCRVHTRMTCTYAFLYTAGRL